MASFDDAPESSEEGGDERMYDDEIVTYEELASGEPKLLLQFYFKAKGKKGVGEYKTVPKQIEFLNTLDDEPAADVLSNGGVGAGSFLLPPKKVWRRCRMTTFS